MAAGKEPAKAPGALPTTESAAPELDEPDGPIGPFATWGRLYAAVLIYGAALILLLLFLTRALDPGSP